MKNTTIALLIALTTLLSACSEGPEQRLETMLRSADKGLVSEAMDVANPAIANGTEHDKLMARNGITKAGEMYQKKGGIAKLETTSETKGETATVHYQITFGNGETEKSAFKMIKIDNKWYVHAG